MGCSHLVAFFVACSCVFGVQNGGTTLASITASKEAEIQEPDPIVFHSTFGKEKEETLEDCLERSFKPPFLEPKGTSTTDQIFPCARHHDMVLQSMRDTKFGQDGYLSKLQEPLDSCLVEISEKRTQQVEEAEGSKGQDRSTTAEEFNIPAGQGDWRGGHGDFRHQGSMGGIHTDFQTSWSKEDRGVYEARGSADTSSCQRSSGFHTGWGIGRQRSKTADTFERLSWHGHSSDPGHGATIQDSLGKAESHGGGSHAFSWASQPFQEGQESDQQCGQKDYCTGSGMDALCSQSDDEVAAPSWLVPNVQAEHVGAVQREETGISAPEDHVVRCLTQTGRIDRGRRTSGGGTGFGTTYAGFAGQHAGGRGTGRNFGCRRYGCRNRGDGGWQAEEDSQAGTIQEIAITEQGSPAHPQEEVEDLQKPSGRDEDLNCILYAKYSWTGGAMSGERAQDLSCAEHGTKCVHFHGEIEVIVWEQNYWHCLTGNACSTQASSTLASTWTGLLRAGSA